MKTKTGFFSKDKANAELYALAGKESKIVFHEGKRYYLKLDTFKGIEGVWISRVKELEM